MSNDFQAQRATNGFAQERIRIAQERTAFAQERIRIAQERIREHTLADKIFTFKEPDSRIYVIGTLLSLTSYVIGILLSLTSYVIGTPATIFRLREPCKAQPGQI